MTSTKAKENKKDSIRKTAKNKPNDGKKKLEKSVKTEKTKGEKVSKTKNIQNTSKINENSPSTKKKQDSEIRKESNDQTLIIDDDDLEGMTVPPSEVDPSNPRGQSPKTEGKPQKADKPTQSTKPSPSQAQKPARRPQAKSPLRQKKNESEEEEEDDDNEDDDEEEVPVKQFSFPAYKILSGASVAPVQMFPQKVVINQSDESAKRHWGSGLTGLFQNSKLTLKLRMLRLLLLWIFFRVLNKQTAWLSDILGIGIPDEEPPGPKVKPPPGERFIKVFREGDPNPFNVRVKKPL